MSYRPHQQSFSNPFSNPFPAADAGSFATFNSPSSPYTANSPFFINNLEPMSGSDSSSSGSQSPGFGSSESRLSVASSNKGSYSFPRFSATSRADYPNTSASGLSPEWSSGRGTSAPAASLSRPVGGGASSRRRQTASQPVVEPNYNESLLRQAHETGGYGPTALPPRPYQGQSPFEQPKPPPPKILQSQMDYLDDVARRVDNVDAQTQELIRQRGQRAIQNASASYSFCLHARTHWTDTMT